MKFSTGRVSRADAAEALARGGAVRNAVTVPVGVTSHMRFSGANPRLDFDRAAACGARPAVAAGSP
ncbi:urease subunit beta [Streptomyces sp. NPDC059104]|uniref:urease subunit beta n=1 Tax=Streptomyces sp. NPDC059104 TaxID=3346729 RepID=UPI0036CB18B6